MDDVYDPCVMGTVTPELITIIEYRNYGVNEMIAEVNYTLGEGSLRPYPIRGRLLLIESDTYDIVAFYLLRQFFKLYFPMIVTFKFTSFTPAMIGELVYQHTGNRYIVAKIFDDRPLELADFYPPTEQNYLFRYHLCLIIFLCKMVGCPLALSDIKVYRGCPFFWRASFLGLHNARTVTEQEFSYLFGISLEDARRVYVGQSRAELNASTISEEGTSYFAGKEKREYVNIKSPMFNAVVDYFREVGFDPELIRACLYLKENPVRSSVGNRAKFKLSNKHSTILKVIEENFSLLTGPYPFKVFRHR